jgi:hypothetical protein
MSYSESVSQYILCWLRDVLWRWRRLSQGVTGILFGLIEWSAKEDRPLGLDRLAGGEELEAPQVGNRAHMLRTVNALQERKAGLIDQAVRQEGVALGKDRFAHQGCALADDKQTHAVLPALQRNLTDAANNPLGIAIEPELKVSGMMV